MSSTTPQLRSVLLVGGTGSRLWPLSRGSYPKQFLPLLGDLSPLQATCERVAGLGSQAPIRPTRMPARLAVCCA